MTHLGRRNQSQCAVHHAKSGTHNRNKSDLSATDDVGIRKPERSFDLNLLERKITGSLIAHEHRDLLNQLAEFLGTCVLVPQQGNLVLNQRVIALNNVAHITFPPAS